ncbi:amino acid adenylation domain-containing protein [Variovorax sp. GB1R11]|uniref:amino acid adenylation domain-containing protein n=1 Tax=Variovorax sp. GB1R11 TaxID=3443741 RepID=UPI003F48B9A0
METAATRRIAERFSRLSSEQRRVVYEGIRSRGLTLGQFPILPREDAARHRCPVSYAQLRQWFLWQLDPQSTAYHISDALKLTGPLDADAVHASFKALVARHESLRTVFRADADGLAEQLIRDSGELDFTLLDLGDADAGAREAMARDAARRICHTPFDLTQGPLMRVALVRLAPETHLLVLVMHHIVSDGGSLQIVVDEFVAQYRACVRHEAVALQAMPVQYADYAVWQRHWLEAGEQERQLAYWKAQLGDAQPVLQLPLDRARRPDARYGAASHRVELPALLVDGLQKRARSQGGTVFMVLLAGFQVLLGRCSGQEDIRVGVPIANRHRMETEGVVGFFVNTQVLRAAVDSRSSLLQVLARTQEAALGAQMHQDLPFEQLVEALQPERIPGVQPLFQVLFNHQRADFSALEGLPGLALAPWDLGTQAAQFELMLVTDESPDGRLHAKFSYAPELFDASTIERMAGHYLAVLQALAQRPEQTVGEVALLSEAESAQLVAWGANAQGFDQSTPVHRLIERQAAAHPDATALALGDQTMSYGELNARANRLAHHLVGLGVKAETRVGIAVERSMEMVVGLLGILKAGGAYVPLDPAYPPERLAYMVRDSGVALLLTQSHLQSLVPGAGALRVLALDTLDLHAQPQGNPQVAVHGQNLAYVIYTSGSTGRPKGAQMCHGNVTRLLDATDAWFGFGPQDTWTLFHSYAFDFSVWEIFGALCTGGTLVIVPFWVSRSPEDFLQLLRARKVTVLNQTPSAFGQLTSLPQAWRDGGDGRDGEDEQDRLSLRVVIFGGEALDPQRLRQWIAHHGDDSPQLVNMYGITETTVHVTYRRITAADLDRQRSPVGLAIPDLGLRVLDAQLNLVPVGVPGELHVSGAGLARGYLHRAGLTSERFVAAANGERLYRTGDLVRWDAEGQLAYLGRIDHQVKVRGFRIELGEIEAQLLAQPEVREAVVVADEGPAGTRLAGYVSAQAGQVADAAQLKLRLGEALPDYMVPAVVMVLDALPLNANGKVNRQALPAAAFTSERAYEAPVGEHEQKLAAIWADVLGVERVGREDDFFELGGHSLLALRLLERMRAQGLAAQVRTLFQQPRLGAFAQALAQAPARAEVVVPANGISAQCRAIEPRMLTLVALDAPQIARIEAAVPGGAANIQDIYPLVPMQEGMLFHHRLHAEADAYVTLNSLSFDSREGLLRFVASFNEVIARHDILRTAVMWEELPEPVQVVHRQAALELQWLADAAPAGVRIDVRKAPMLAAVAAHDALNARWLLQLSSHHLVVDHTTLELVVEEIALIQQGRRAELSAPVPFRRFVGQARLDGGQAGHQAFFSQMLADVEEPTAPFGLLDVQGDGTRVREASVVLDTGLAAQVRHQAQAHGVSAAALFHTAWAMVLGKTAGRDDVVFGTVLFGRMQGGANVDRALGMFINTLPVRIRLGTQGVQACVRHTHAALIELMHHEYASLSLAQRCSGLPQRMPLFTALLNYRYGARQGKPAKAVEAAQPWQGMQILGSRERTNYPVEMAVDDLGEGFALAAQIHESVDAGRVCGLMIAAVDAVVQALAQQPERRVCELELMSGDEQRQLAAWGENTVRYDGDLPVHRLIERQVARHPQAVALVFGDQALSYAELNARANRLAHCLIALGVKPETRVGIALERSIDMVVGVLAVLKAGGAYVPLDPEHPADRLAHMVAESGIGWLLTQSHLGALWPRAGALRVLALDTLDTGGCADANPQVALDGENLAYVIYTSGSTGKPKGVMVRHRSLSHFMRSMKDAPGMAPDDVLVAVTSLSFDIAALELYLPLLSGARIVLASRDAVRSGGALGELLHACGATVLQSTPAGWRLLRATGWNGSRRAKFKGLCGGEALQQDLADDLLALGVELWNMYGPTETTIWSTAARVRGTPRIGGPIAATTLHVLDGFLNPAPVGVPGELFLGGIGLARGYFQRAALTSERFVAAANGERLYRTGDLVRWDAEGQLAYLGRIDHQVKVRGFRIELGEIEAQLLAQPEVREAVVVARESADGAGGTGGASLVGYIALQAGQAMDTAVLRTRLAAALPDYMVPAAVVVLERLPLNGNGKVDRKALRAVEFASERAYEAPADAVEAQLAALWAQVLGVARVGRHDNFFELGGHSLLAAQLASRARVEGGFELPLRRIFEHPVLLDLAGVARQAMHEAPPAGQEPVLQPIGRVAEMKLSPAQQRLWLVNRLADASAGQHAAYNISAALRLSGALDVDLVRATLDALVQRHEVLRTWFPENDDGDPVARIAPGGGLVVPLTDLSHLAGERQASAMHDALAAHAGTAFDLGARPAFAAAVLRLQPEVHVLLLCVHHIVFDGWSEAVFVQDFMALYAALRAGRDSPLAPLAIQYADYADWHHRKIAQRFARDAAFWRGYLQGAPAVSTLGPDRARPRVASTAGDTVGVDVGHALAQALHGLARAQKTSLYVVLLSTFLLMLHRQAATDDLVVGTDVAGRDHPALEDLIGFFVGVVPLRSRLAPALAFVQWLAKVKESTLSAFEHQDVPFEQIVELAGVPRTREHSPLVQVLFVMQNTPEGRFEIPGVVVEPIPKPVTTSKFDLAVFVSESARGLRAEWTFASGLYRRETIERASLAWRDLLQQVVAAPEGLLAHFVIQANPETKTMSSSSPALGKLHKLKKFAEKERGAPAAPRSPVRTSFLSAQRTFPLVIEAASSDIDAVAWAREQRDSIEASLCTHGGILLRNFGLRTPQEFEAFAEVIEPELYGGYGDLPKKEGGRNTYRSTPYPERQMILFHNESSHLERWPRKQWFYCEQPSPVGGATPIVDCREMLRHLPPDIVAEFERKELLYVRTFMPRLDVSWQDFFKTDSKAQVEHRLALAGTAWRWLDDETLQTRTRCPAVITHPVTGERVFFNQVQLHHASCLEADAREDLLAVAGGLDRLPRHVTYGDGTPIDDQTMAVVGRAYEACAVRFDWRQGDVVMLDNMLAAHARDPYEGPRKIVVAMGAMCDRATLARAAGAGGNLPAAAGQPVVSEG